MLKNQEIKRPVLIEDLGMQFASDKSKVKYRYGLYLCFCGNEFKAMSSHIRSGHTKKCGCTKNHHKSTNHRLAHIWYGMMDRCHNKNNKGYQWYGAKGVKVCDRWKDIKKFIKDMNKNYQNGLTIDRINPNGDNEPENCRWVGMNVQNRNTRLLQKNNTSGFRGVSAFKNGKYRAYITLNYKQIHLGCFNTDLEAAKAYDKYVINNKLEHTINGVLNV